MEVFDVIEKRIKDGGNELPVFGAAGEESFEPKGFAFEFVDIDDGEIAATGRGDVETEANARSVRARRRFKKFWKRGNDVVVDLALASFVGTRVELAEAAGDVIGFEVETLDGVVVAAALDGGPFDDVSGGRAEGIAHVGLLKDFFGAGAGAAIGEELRGSEIGVGGAIDDVEQAEFDGVGHGDAEVEIPGAGGRLRVEG